MKALQLVPVNTVAHRPIFKSLEISAKEATGIAPEAGVVPYKKISLAA